jgi:glycerophosphoryl diester phosphodiesterase
VARKIFKWLTFFLLAAVLIMSVIYGSLATTKGEPAAQFAFFAEARSGPLVIAHRGGGGIAPENTLNAFERSAALGVDVLELDVRGTSDGELIVLHDATVDRTTDGNGPVNQMTLAEVKKLNAGFRWSPDGGQSFSFRESGVQIPTLREVFAAFPKMKFNIEPKPQTPSLVRPLCDLIREYKMSESVVIASFDQTIIDEFRAACGEIATSASTSEVARFLTMYKTGLSQSYSPQMQALQVPESAGVQILSKEFVEAAHERNLQVHVWTINEKASMERLIEMNVDGIMTDYPDRLLELLKR